jgi:hypothetical protein
MLLLKNEFVSEMDISSILVGKINMQAIKQYTEVIDGSIHINLPKNFTAKRVELIILSADDNDTDTIDFQKLNFQKCKKIPL